MTDRPILLNPGPVTISDRVRRALLGPDLCHREREFFDLQDAVRAGLLGVYDLDGQDWASVLLTGSGTAAVEAMIATLGPRSGRLLVIENGVYGQRMAAIAAAHGIDCTPLSHEWDQPVDLDRLDRALSDDPSIRLMAVVHHETTTGRLNDLRGVANVCGRRDAGLLLDAVSSFGAEAIDFRAWPIHACAATANKCLHGVPGICFVIVRRGAMPPREARPRSVYLDLARHARAQDDRGTLFTPAVHCLYALREALLELSDEGGRPARYDRYASLASIVAEGLADLGVEPLLSADESSVVLRAYRLPPGVSYNALHDGLKERGFVIYNGQGEYADRLFRISTMGAIERADARRIVSATRAVIKAGSAGGNAAPRQPEGGSSCTAGS